MSTKNFLAATFIGKHADATQQAEILDMLGLTDEFGMCTEDDDKVWTVGVAGPVGGRYDTSLRAVKYEDRPRKSTAPESLKVLPSLEQVARSRRKSTSTGVSNLLAVNKSREAECGTYMARRRHQRRGEPLCALCVDAPKSHKNSTAQKARVRREKGIPRAKNASCGTDSGYKKHRRLGTPTCEACKEAHAESTRASARRQGVKPRPIARCGTESGYSAHLVAKTVTCEPCRKAKRDATRARYQARKAA